jgi:FG-GAP repeat
MEKRNVVKVLFLSLIVAAVLNACGTSTEVKTGVLELTIGGLTGVDASVTVTGPNSFNQSVKASTKLENLAVGSYTITASDVIQGDTYFPDKRQQSAVIKGGETTSLAVTYSKQEASAGSLEITINGLPAGTNADVTITGPNGFSQSVTTSSVLSNLTPSDYQLTAKVVKVGSDTYTPIPASHTISITAGGKTEFTVTYTKQTSTVGQLAVRIKGLPTGLTATATVTGPSGFSETLTASKTFSDLLPGEYTVTAAKVDGTYPYNPSPKTQTINVVAGESTNALLAYVPTIPPPHAAENTGFGFNVAVEGDLMVVGAPFANFGTSINGGRAYLYQRSSSGEWLFLKELIPDNGHDVGDHFGTAVAVSGDTVVVGAPNAVSAKVCDLQGNCTDIRGGLAYVFKRNEGGQNNFGSVATLVASDFHNDSDNFGHSVAISGNIIVVGANVKDVDLDKSGTIECGGVINTECGVGEAYIFEEAEETKTWREMKTLLASDAAGGEVFGLFGEDVSISGDTVVIGRPRDDKNSDETGTGAAYIFQRNQSGQDTWGEVKKLVASDGVKSDFFGYSVAISGDLAVVGIASENNQSEASAYVFQRNQGGTNTWGEVKKLSIGGIFEGNDASNVAVKGDVVVMAVPFMNGDVNGDGSIDCQPPFPGTGEECLTGTALVYQRDAGGKNNFGLVQNFVSSDGAKFDALGSAVAISDNGIVIGAPRHATVGAVYVLESALFKP